MWGTKAPLNNLATMAINLVYLVLSFNSGRKYSVQVIHLDPHQFARTRALASLGQLVAMVIQWRVSIPHSGPD